MGEVASSVNINDIPEELKGYRKALLNAAFGQVFRPEYLQMQIPTAEFPWATNPNKTAVGTQVVPEQPLSPGVQQNNHNSYLSQIAGMGNIGDSAGSFEEMLSNRVQYASGGLAKAAEEIEKYLSGGVNLGASGTPLGAYTAPMTVDPGVNLPINISTGTRQPPAPTPPSVTPPATAGPNGVITTPTTGTLPVGNPNPMVTPPPVGTGITPPPAVGGGLNPTPGGIPSQLIPGRPTHSQAPAMFSASKPNNFAGADQAARGGYNPAQYADDSVAQDLARQMGGQVVYTNTVGPGAPPSQAMIDAGGSAMHNAGLIADINKRFADDEGMRKFALENLRQEIRSYGGDTGGFAQGGIVKYAEGGAVNTFAPAPAATATNSQFGTPAPSGFGSQNMGFTGVGTTQSGQVSLQPANTTGGTPQIGARDAVGMGGRPQFNQTNTNPDGTFNFAAMANKTPTPMQASQQRSGELSQDFLSAMGNKPAGMSQYAYYDGNKSQWVDDGPGLTELQTQSSFNSTPVNPLGASNISGTGPTPPGMQAGAFNPYQAYGKTDPATGKFVGSQRILGMGDQGQVDNNGFLQASDLTRNALSGYGNLPSYFNQNGTIAENRNAQGESTTPLGIAGDTFNAAGKLALDASTRAGNASYESPLQSTFGTALSKIADNPSMFQAGDISLGQLEAPQLQSPLGVGTSQLTSYQMQGPRLIDTSTSNINPTYIGGQSLNQYQAQGSGPVQAGQIGVGKFIDTGVRDAYMSPYMQSVVDVQRDQANRDFRESAANRSAAAIKAGAFGGNRQAVADSLAERDRANLLNQIQATGSQAAFENAQQQYERDRGASINGQQFNVNSRLQADLANQGAGQAMSLANLQALLGTQQLGATLGQQANLANQGAYMDAATKNQGTNLQAQLANQGAIQAANQANLGAALGVQELGAGQYMQSQLANQQAGLTAGQANQNAALQTQALARNSGLTAAQANQQTRLSQNTTLLDALAKADQLQQQAGQGNFSNQLNAMGQQTNSALAANTIGQSRADLGRLAQAQELLRLQATGQAGAGIDTRTQGALDLGYQDWTNQQNYPYQQMNWLQSMLSGTPMGYNQEGVQFQKTNPLSQIAGLGTAALGAYKASQG